MAAQVYRCWVCHKNFPRLSLKGRLPRACPEHRKVRRAQVDQKRHSSPKHEYPPCCEDSPNKVCTQHKQFRRFKYHWHHKVTNPEVGQFLAEIFETSKGDPTYNPGFTIGD